MSTIDPPAPSIPIGGGGGDDVPAWSRPDIIVAAPGGISAFTPANSIFSAGNTVAVVAQHNDQLAGANYAVAVDYGMVIFTDGKATNPDKPNQETGIRMHAASGSVAVEALTGAAKITADRNIEVSSATGMVKITAPISILLTAGGAALDIQSGSITLRGPGTIEFKAAMKIIDGPPAPVRPLTSASPANSMCAAARSTVPHLHRPAPCPWVDARAPDARRHRRPHPQR